MSEDRVAAAIAEVNAAVAQLDRESAERHEQPVEAFNAFLTQAQDAERQRDERGRARIRELDERDRRNREEQQQRDDRNRNLFISLIGIGISGAALVTGLIVALA